MNGAGDEKIKTPFSRLLVLWRRRYLPVLIWGGAVALAVVLVQQQRVYVDATGVVDSKTTFVASVVDGTVRSLAVDLLDPVEEGQVVAVMDDTLVRAEMAVAEAELSRARALLDAEMARYKQEMQVDRASVQSDLRRFQINEEQARLDHLDRVIQHETDKVTLQRLRVQLKREEAMVEQHLLGEAALDETRLAYESLKTKVEKDRESIALAEKNIETAAQRRQAQQAITPESESVATESDAMLRALQADIAAQQALLAEVQERRRALTLVAPVSGQVAAITKRPGESVLAGDPVLTITGAGANRVVAYVDERSASKFNVGDPVEVQTRAHPATVAKGKVLKVGDHVEPFPLRLLSNPNMPKHGFSILVGNLPENVFRPGETLDIRLKATN